MAMLEVKNLGISFGGLRAVDSLDMTIEKVARWIDRLNVPARPRFQYAGQVSTNRQTA